MPASRKRVSSAALEQLKNALDYALAVARENGGSVSAAILDGLATFEERVHQARTEIDKIRLPRASFDPFEPQTVGRMVALALLAQPKEDLSGVPDSYGSGIYALYYIGNHPFYKKISKTETPIYVGKADPSLPDANTPRQQGNKLTGRLREHAKTIKTVETYAAENGLPEGMYPIKLEDFLCRRLVCATNAQLVAEVHLIRMFRPLWNSETKACFGMSKHGDSAETRSNKRSPWDVVHPGRAWASDDILENSASLQQIKYKIDAVLEDKEPRQNIMEILDEILETFRQ
jgi:hypothetical protein